MDDCLILIAETSFWLKPESWWAMARVLIGLGMVIFVHELGHFLVAKACGVKCEKFYVGFDVPIKLFGVQILPAAFFRKTIGETEYGIGTIPLGGYVKMLGQDDNPANIEKEIERSQGEGSAADEDGKIEADGFVDRNELDPRSFRAKSVLQRMAIISAGVIFNLIFAVFFAAFAFRGGVDYQPASLGPVVGGGPAWEADIADATLFRVGGEEVHEDRYFTFIDMVQEIIFSASSGPIEFELQRRDSDEREVVSIQARRGFDPHKPDFPMVGVRDQQLPVIGSDESAPATGAASASEKLLKGDRIIAVNDIKIENTTDLRSSLNLEAIKPVTLKLERGEGDQKEIITSVVDANPVREYGFSIKWDAVTAIQINSPAETAGFKVGDKIKTVNGDPAPDVLTFDMEIMSFVRDKKSVEIGVERDGKMVSLNVTPRVPHSGTIQGSFPVIALDTLGVAISVSDEVGSVDSSRSEVSSLKAGDKLVSVTYVFTEEWRDHESFKLLHEKTITLKDDKTHLAEINAVVQRLPFGTQLKCVATRGVKANEKIEFTVDLQASEKLFIPQLGIHLSPDEAFYQAKTWSEAMKNGASQVWADGTRVFTFLKKVVSGELSATNFGGPGTIAVVATSEASQGTSRLLLFLTLLSANLAVVNFLPIPVLDGGHMMFLAYEGLFRRPVSQNVEILLTYAGLFFVLGLMLFVIYLDVGRISGLSN